MSIDRARHFADQAALSIQAGQADLGLQLAEQALQLDPHLGDAANLRGVALSLSGQPRLAEEAWMVAAEMMPGSGKPFYNMAVHFYALGRKQESLDWTARALTREPNHAPAFSLQSLILEQASHLKANLDLPFEYSQTGIPAGLTQQQGSWALAGWTLAGLSLISVMLATKQTIGTNDRISVLTASAFLASYFGGLIFLFCDAARSGRSYGWAAAYGFVGCIAGWLVLPAYLLAGVKRANESLRPKSGSRK
jgi:tetratricopeptide (TPR) repeat protein